MSLNIDATKFYDEMRKALAPLSIKGTAIELEVRYLIDDNRIPMIAVFDRNNDKASPFVLMTNFARTGRRWANEAYPVGTPGTYAVVEAVRRLFDEKLLEWKALGEDVTLDNGSAELIRLMKSVSGFLL